MYTTKTVMVPRQDSELPVHRWIPTQPPRAGVVIVQEIFGVSTYIRQRAADLAREGYVVDVPDLYFRLADPVVADDDPELLARGMELMAHTPWEQAARDLLAATSRLKSDLPALAATDRLACVGFCYGGGLAYAAAADAEANGSSPIDALVSYYGSALPTLLDRHVRVPSLHHFGTADQFIPMDQVEQIRAHVEADGARFRLYEGADHAFDNSLPAFHHAHASREAWEETVTFLRSMLDPDEEDSR